MQLVGHLMRAKIFFRKSCPKGLLLRREIVTTPTYSGPERRRGESIPSAASRTLAHAVAYLINNQRSGLHADLLASRAAIRILCDAGRTLSLSERRTQENKRTELWLKKASGARRDLTERRLRACRYVPVKSSKQR